MNDATQKAYRLLAANFYRRRLRGEMATAEQIVAALQEAAADYRPAYWRRLRNALAFDLRDRGLRCSAELVAATINPVTANQLPVKRKQKRIHTVSWANYVALTNATLTLDDNSVAAMALYFAYHLGCRPAEMPSVKVISETEVLIVGAKRTSNRGQDRQVQLPPDIVKGIELGTTLFREVGLTDMKPVQNRLRRLAKTLWPQRKHVPTLYSFRHQLGADLKASVASGAMTIEEVAYIMGHQSTESCEVYGDRRTASTARRIRPANGADLSPIRLGRTDRRLPPSTRTWSLETPR